MLAPAIFVAVAKITISMPDDLLARIDAQVKTEHATRSEFFQRLAKESWRRSNGNVKSESKGCSTPPQGTLEATEPS
jgi:metal-responsive CopG/Arc/MetJ family transcriptional regulator